MLKGDALLAKVNEMREDAANTNSAIALACGYVRDNGKPDFVEFYTQLLDAKGLLNNDDEDEEVSEVRADLNERFGSDAVDAFCEIWSDFDLDFFEDAYVGCYESGAEYAEELVSDCYGLPRNLPSFVEIDWEATWQNLQHDYYFQDGFIFNANW